MAVVQSWLNKGSNALPEWAKPHVIGHRETNGSFMIHTRAGQEKVQARCLPGYLLIEREGAVYTRHPSEARAFLAEMDGKEQIVIDEMADRATRPARNAKHVPVAGGVGHQVNRSESGRKSPQTGGAQPERKSAFPPAIGRMPTPLNCAPSELKIDDSYQRSIDTGPSRALIAKIAHGWDWRMCLPLVVSKRADDSLYVIDGQHRLAAAQLRGDIAWLPCCVGEYNGIADEAAMFVAMNRARRAINRLDDFHAATAGGDGEALKIVELVTDAGFTVSRKTGSATWVPGEVAFTSAIATVLRKHGERVVREALKAMADAFPGQRLVAGSSVFTALCRVLISPPEDFERDRLFRALGKFDMQGWADFLKGAKGGDDRAQKLRDVLLMAYAEVAA